MVQTATLLRAKLNACWASASIFRQSEDSGGVVAMATAGGSSIIVNVQQRRLAADFGDKSTDPAPHQQSPRGQFSQRAVNHHSAVAKQRDQLAFRRNTGNSRIMPRSESWF